MIHFPAIQGEQFGLSMMYERARSHRTPDAAWTSLDQSTEVSVWQYAAHSAAVTQLISIVPQEWVPRRIRRAKGEGNPQIVSRDESSNPHSARGRHSSHFKMSTHCMQRRNLVSSVQNALV